LNGASLMMNPIHVIVPSLRAVALSMLILFPACTQEKKIDPAVRPIARIISLSPSITREIADLGAERLLVGVTSYDDYRGSGKEIVGTLIQPNIEKIILLKPDLVLYSAEDGLVQNAERLADAGITSRRFARNKNFDDILKNYLIMAEILGREETARKKIGQYREARDRVKGATRSGVALQRPRAAFLLSCSPLIVASSDSFIGQVIRDAGGTCPYGGGGGPHPLISIEALVESDPDLIISMSGGEDTGDFFRRLEDDFRELKAVRHGNIFTIADNSIPYYTPADYVTSLEKIAVMIRKAKTAPHVSRSATDVFRE
jgi:iron complex transport system substrate-binding protein